MQKFERVLGMLCAAGLVGCLSLEPEIGAAGADGAPGESASVRVSAEPVGANCAQGGQKIEAAVGASPATVSYVCNGMNGVDGVASSATVDLLDEPPGANCAAGGKRIITRVGSGPVSVAFVCNGEAGSSVVAVAEAPGQNCANGGIKLNAGTEVQYVCNGSAGADGAMGPAGSDVVTHVEPAGPNCAHGGVRISSAAGDNYVCNGAGAARWLNVNAGADLMASVDQDVLLAGSVSSEAFAVRWVQLFGPAVTVVNDRQLSPVFRTPSTFDRRDRRLVFQLQATDGNVVETDLVVVVLNQAPTFIGSSSIVLTTSGDLTGHVLAYDPDDDALQFSVVESESSLPQGFVFFPSSGRFIFPQVLGCHTLTATMTDGWVTLKQTLTIDIVESFCGDGITLGSEACDDGNGTSGDGCSSSCTVEVGHVCSGQPSFCASVCGDGILAGMESCEDGNTSNGDGCSEFCTVE